MVCTQRNADAFFNLQSLVVLKSLCDKNVPWLEKQRPNKLDKHFFFIHMYGESIFIFAENGAPG